MRTYDELLRYLDQLQKNIIQPGLERIDKVCESFGRPERKFRSIHIAGTNGKGSTAAFLESIIRNSGYKVGLLTSPHLVDVRERIQIDRKWIAADKMVDLSNEIRERCKEISPSYFEFLIALAFLCFSREGVDVAIIETGLGGRWDATNIIRPVLTILTPVSIDHTSFLGRGIESIANEKCGIIKEGVTLVTSEQHSDVNRIIRAECERNHSPLVLSRSFIHPPYLSLQGDHQVANAALAVTAAQELKKFGLQIQDYNQPLGHTHWPGRLQTISYKPEILLDGAHNPHACSCLVRYIKEKYEGREVVLIFGAMKDKDLHGMVEYLKGLASGWILFQLDGERAADPRHLQDLIGGRQIDFAQDPSEAIDKASEFGFKNPLIVVTGSLYLVGRFLTWSQKWLKNEKSCT